MNVLIKNFVLAILIFIAIGGIFSLFYIPPAQIDEISATQLANDINQDKIKKITISGDQLEIAYADGKTAVSMKEAGSSLADLLADLGVDKAKLQNIEIGIAAVKENVWSWLTPLLVFGILPLVVFGLFFWMMIKQARSGAVQVFDFTKAKARLFGAEGHGKEKITFKDVAGLKEAKEELVEIVDFLKFPKKYLAMGAKIPRGVLLLGTPGVGKTLLARAVAGEANVPFLSISGSEFVEMFVGVGSSVAGDTKILIKTGENIKLLPIAEFIDKFYKNKEEGLKTIQGVETLGANFSSGNKFLKSTGWKKVKGAYRHKVKEIYTIKFLGGKIKTTADHSVFIRDKNRVVCKRTSELKQGNVLAGLPFKVRSVFKPREGTTHKIKGSQLFEDFRQKELNIWEERSEIYNNYQFAIDKKGLEYQREIAEKIGVSQMTISLWQRGLAFPRLISKKACPSKNKIPSKVKTNPDLMKILGYYTAEGRTTKYYVQFVFGIHEKNLHKDCIRIMKNIFNVNPHLASTEDNSLRITYHSKFLSEFFENQCGTGSKNKHIPEILWSFPKNYLLKYLEGYSKGDGFISSEKRLIMSSVSKQLMLELAWLCAIHGIQSSIGKNIARGGRVIKKNPLPETVSWTLKIGKTANPFINFNGFSDQFKKPVIKEIKKESYNDYVYDLCGCENEAFFGGEEKPILLHNSRVRDLFSTAKKAAPAIIFIDELDAIGRHRGAGIGGGHDEREQTLNQILVEMDGFERDTNVIVTAATNRGDILDPALLRPGRFDRKIVLDPPDVHDREEVLKIHSKGKPLSTNIDLKEVAERTPGFSGADLANVANEAALLAARQNKTQIFQQEFLEAIEKVLLGPERKSHILSKKEKEIAAYHEAGHALVSSSLDGTEPVRKISIIARGMAAGYTLQTSSEERRMKTKTQFLAELSTLLGGYCAEKIKFGEMTTGASNDLTRASDLARKLIKEYGMSSLGPISFGEKEEIVFLGKEISEQRNYSEKVASKIDEEVEKFIRNAEKTAIDIITKKKGLLDKIAKTLIEKETIEREEFEKLINGGKKNNKKA